MDKPVFSDMSAGGKALLLFSLWFITALLFGFAGGQIAETVFGFNPTNTSPSDITVADWDMYRGAMWVTTILGNPLAAVVAALTFTQLAEVRGIGVLKFRNPIRRNHLPFLIFLGIATAAGSFAVQYLNEEFLDLFGSSTKELDELSKETNARYEIILSGGWSTFIMNSLLLAIIVPIGEEFLFRGGLQRYLIFASKRITAGVLFSAFVFALVHYEFDGFLVRFGMGVLLGFVFVRTNSIWTSVLVHGVYNFTSLAITLLDENNYISEQMGIIIPVAGLITTGILIFYMVWKKPLSSVA